MLLFGVLTLQNVYISPLVDVSIRLSLLLGFVLSACGMVYTHFVLLFNHHVNRDCLAYMFSLSFSRSKFLINLRRQFCVRKFFRTQVLTGFAVFSFCV